jgi:hypothetical protein
MTTVTPEQIAGMAPIALTYLFSDVVNVRMQTEHLYAVEQNLAERGVPADLVAEHFDDLHRCPPLSLGTWLAAVTEAYNRTNSAAGQP